MGTKVMLFRQNFAQIKSKVMKLEIKDFTQIDSTQ